MRTHIAMPILDSIEYGHLVVVEKQKWIDVLYTEGC